MDDQNNKKQTLDNKVDETTDTRDERIDQMRGDENEKEAAEDPFAGRIIMDESDDDEKPKKKEPTHATPNAAMSLLSIENNIKMHLANLEKTRQELKEYTSMFNDSFANDAEYKKLNDQAKDANRLKNTAKQRILKQPAVMELQNKLKHMKEDIKEMQDALSDYARSYIAIAGTNQMTTDEGEILEFVQTTKLVRKRK